MRINNFTEVVEQLKPYLKEYLESQDTEFSRSHFTCPNRNWHKNNDSKPSCSFYPDENHFHCFACNINGDIFTAANLLEGLPVEGAEFASTVMELANRFSIKVEAEEDAVDKEVTRLKNLLDLVKDVSHKTYCANGDIQKYVAERGLTEIASKAKFGYCNYDRLEEFLISKGFSKEDIDSAGLFRELLHERLLIPVFNEFGRVVAFGSRQVKKDESQRYYNSKTSIVYKKSEVLYNLNIAKTYESIIAVEGYMDALQLMSKGIYNVVAVCGDVLQEKHIQKLVKYKVKKLVVCLDNDEAGKAATQEALKILSNVSDLETRVLELKDAKDPDEFIKKFGKEAFLSLPSRTIFDFKLEKFQQSNMDKNAKEDILQHISAETSHMEKENMCKRLAKIANVKVETVLSEIERVEKSRLGESEVTTSDIVNERDSMLKEIFLFDQWSQTRGKLLGLPISQYPIMTEKLDGIQSGFYVIAAEENTGKSTLTTSLMLYLAQSNPGKVMVLYFGLDIMNRNLVARMVANLSTLPINTVSNPKWHIEENETLSEEEKKDKLQRRENAINELHNLAESISIKDEKTVMSLEHMEKMVKTYLKVAEGKQLVVMVDSLNQISTSAKKETRDTYMYISDKLKEWTVRYDIPVFAISELRKLPHPGMRPTNDDIKEVGDLKYDADCTILLYNEFHSKRNDAERTFVGPNGVIYPIVELIFFKNKLSGFKGTLFYKFYTDISKVEECSLEEHRRYWTTH